MNSHSTVARLPIICALHLLGPGACAPAPRPLVTIAPHSATADDASVIRDESARRIDAHLTALVPWGFSGNVLVARRDTVLLAKGYGMANREQNIPFTARTQIPIGSIVKDFTKAAIQALANEGRLRRTDSLGRYFPEMPAEKAVITIEQLLAHSSGIPMSVGDQPRQSRADFFRAVAAAPLAGPPGGAFIYSNAGFSILAAIIEDVTGQDFESFVRERLLLPNQMTETGWYHVRWDSTRVGHTYDARGARAPSSLGFLRTDDPRAPWGRHGAGVWFSTLDDLFRWSRVTPTRPIRAFTTGQSWGSLGGTETYETAIRYYPADSLTVVLHNNVNGSLSQQLSAIVGRIALGLPIAPAPPAPLSPATVEAGLEGVYVLATGGGITVETRGDGVALLPSGQDAFDAVFNAPADGLPQRQGYAARSDSIIAATLRGDWSSLIWAVPPDRTGTAEEYLAQQRATAAHGLGQFTGHRVIGVIPTSMGGHAIVQLSYERGERYERIGWAGPRVALYRQESEPPHVLARPAAAGGFVQFDNSTATARIFLFVPPRGNVAASLDIPTPAGKVTAVRQAGSG